MGVFISQPFAAPSARASACDAVLGAKGAAEEVLGAVLQDHRADLLLAAQCPNPSGADVNARGGSRRHVTRVMEGSVKRLRIDRREEIKPTQ
jgi:hypothetical protein